MRPCGSGKPPNLLSLVTWLQDPSTARLEPEPPAEGGRETNVLRPASRRSSLTRVIESRRFRPSLGGRSRKSGGLRVSRWRRASTSRCSVSSRRSTSTASRREPPTVVTGDRLPPSQANPDLTPSPPPDTPTVGAQDGRGLGERREVMLWFLPVRGQSREGDPDLGLSQSDARGSQRQEGVGAVKPCLAGNLSVVGCGGWCHKPFSFSPDWWP